MFVLDFREFRYLGPIVVRNTSWLLFILFFQFSNPGFSQENFYLDLSTHALSLTEDQVTYDPSYFSITYPNGKIPSDKGVCTDVIIRTYRKMNIDLQQLIHEDMEKHFDCYPKIWGLTRTDTNIDHRRVPNLMVFFERFGKVLPITNNPQDYSPGDIVCWNLGGAITHIGIVSAKKSISDKRHLIVHNIGAGQVVQDCLFDFKIIGHYRYKKE